MLFHPYESIWRGTRRAALANSPRIAPAPHRLAQRLIELTELTLLKLELYTLYLKLIINVFPVKNSYKYIAKCFDTALL